MNLDGNLDLYVSVTGGSTRYANMMYFGDGGESAIWQLQCQQRRLLIHVNTRNPGLSPLVSCRATFAAAGFTAAPSNAATAGTPNSMHGLACDIDGDGNIDL